ncbi:hypothetical protein GMST_04770 [Geomonas silvestris]|uniref:DUF4398 domain-containing protein n=1 Tax=Geomonas silvestris TaxID=2740184 RepID=A0A6V8MDW6_9BACT|nr:hypothetical protein [Geomonas silvestris]GFO58152.1 hypothetical protein GMST_04770 [Geomonas silvestris]
MKPVRLSLVALFLLCSARIGFAAEVSVESIQAQRPNLANAYRLSLKAHEKVVAAEKADQWDAEGHAERAKALLEQASEELRQAARAGKNAR